MKRTFGVAVLAGLVMSSGCSQDTGVRVIKVVGGPDSTTLELSVDSCNRHPVARVTESDTEVRIRVSADPEGSGGGDCADGASVNLAKPLGDRSVIDEVADKAVALTSPG